MARRRKEIQIGIERKKNPTDSDCKKIKEEEITVSVFEVRPADVYAAYDAIRKGGSLKVLIEDEYFLERCTDLGMEDVRNLYPSEMEKLIDAFREVNSSFLAPWPTIKRLIQKVGLVDWLGQMIEKSGIKNQVADQLVETWSHIAQDLQNEDTPESGSMDGHTS